MAAPDLKTIAVLGAGITGLTAAHRLHRLGHRVRVFEQSERVGGAIQTERHDGWLVESGPNSILSGEPSLDALIAELALDAARVKANPAAKKRFLVRRGRLVVAPLSPRALLSSPLFSPLAKLAIFSELAARRRVRTSDVSLADFIGSHFGREFVDYALNPFVSGVYAGDPRKLSARHAFPKLWELEQTHGSLLRGQLALARERRQQGGSAPAIFSFSEGLQMLPDRLAAALPDGAIQREATLDAILPGGNWSVVWHDAHNTHTETFDAIVVALPAPALAQLRIGSLGERPLAALSAIEHPPVSSLFLGYRLEQVAHPLDGFGLLVPARENRRLLGVLFSSTLFPGRAPAGHVAITVMTGGARQPELATLTDPALFEEVGPDLAELLGVRGEPAFVRRRVWPRAIPQYNLGYEQFLGALNAAERSHRGLFFGGQARDGISVPACVAAGEKLAARVIDGS